MKIEKDIPNPYFTESVEHPWSKMEKGGSVLIKKDTEAALKSLRIHAGCGGGVFSTKFIGNGIWVWKVL